jgi:23S rRNA pseudouridine1911/1915/1917 synthase
MMPDDIATPDPRTHLLHADDAAKRLDKFITDAVVDATLSRSRIKALILDGFVTVAGEPCRDPSRKLKAGQPVAITLPEPVDAEPVGEAIPLASRYEDRHLIVIDKPAGMVVHPAAGHAAGTLVNALIAHCGDSLSGIGGVKRPGIVHRLDKDTSGLMVVAKTDAAHRHLAAQFADHGRTGALMRAYLALVWGELPRRQGTIEANLERSSANREKMAVVDDEHGRYALTHYTVEESFTGASGDALVANLLRCELETGRTHQIRVHMAHLGHPLLGDAVYGGGFKTKAALLAAPAQRALAALGRQALHATLLGFEHPQSGEVLRFESPPPPDMARLIAALRRP